MNDKLTLNFHATNVNGYPSIKIILDGVLLLDKTFTNDYDAVVVLLPRTEQEHILEVIRYGKTNSQTGEKDQIVEIKSALINGVEIPSSVITDHCTFTFENQVHPHSLYFGPNGTWTFRFSTPFITFILDDRMKYTAEYFDWGYELTRSAVNNILLALSTAKSKIEEVL